MTTSVKVEETNLARLAAKVDAADAEVRTLDAPSQAKALALKTAIEEFHKEGLIRIVRALKEDPRGKEILFTLVDVPEVYALLSMHGLVRADLRTRVSRVIDMVRPYMQSHGGDVELVDVTPTTVFVRLSGACHGCSMSAQTLRNSVEEAIREHITEPLKVEQLTNEPTTAFIPLGMLANNAAGWHPGPMAADLKDGKPVSINVDKISILLLRTEDKIQAFRNSCAHMGLPLDGGMVDCEAHAITCPWHGFRFDTVSGECLNAPGAQLEPFPVRIEEGCIYVRPN